MRRLIQLTLAGLVLSALPAARAQQAPYDLIIRGGHVLDGTGNPWIDADVGVRGDRIAAVGRLTGATARREIDARGLVVTPGFKIGRAHV